MRCKNTAICSVWGDCTDPVTSSYSDKGSCISKRVWTAQSKGKQQTHMMEIQESHLSPVPTAGLKKSKIRWQSEEAREPIHLTADKQKNLSDFGKTAREGENTEVLLKGPL